MLRKAIILAAGRGTRVQPLTHDMPKPMIPLMGKPVMQHIVEHLARQGVREIMVNVSHMADQIESYFGDGQRFGVQIGYSFEGHLDGERLVPQPLGSAGALRRIQDFGGFIDQTTAVLCGDALIDLDLQAAAACHRAQGAIATVVTREVPLAEVPNYGVVVTRDDGRVVAFQEKPSPEAALSRQASTGVYLIEPDAVAAIPEGVYDIGSQLFPALVARGAPFFAQSHDAHWLDIGRVADYWRITLDLLASPLHGMTVPGREVRPGVFVGLNTRVDWDSLDVQGPVHIGSGARIEPGVVLRGPVWIGQGCHVEAGAHIERSVLMNYAHIGANACARSLIVSGRYCVTPEGQPVPTLAPGVRGWGDVRAARGPAAAAGVAQ